MVAGVDKKIRCAANVLTAFRATCRRGNSVLPPRAIDATVAKE